MNTSYLINYLILKGYDKFTFEERKQYEETFVENNSALIEELTGASDVYGYKGEVSWYTNWSDKIKIISSIHLQNSDAFNKLFEIKKGKLV